MKPPHRMAACGPHYETIVRPYLSDLRKYCLYLSGSVWDGEDLYQEALLKSLRYYARTGDIQDAKPFLFRVAKNLWIDEYRLRGRRKTAAPAKETKTADISYPEIRGWLEWLVLTLSERQLAVLLLADYFGYTMKEIAFGLGVTMPAVRSLLHRARERLRTHLAAGDRAPLSVPERTPALSRQTLCQVDEYVRSIMQDNPALLFRRTI